MGLEHWAKLASNSRRLMRSGIGNDLLLRSAGAGRPGHDRGHKDQCRPRQRLDLPQAAYLQQAGRAHHGDRQRRQSCDQPVGAVDPDRRARGPPHRRDRNASECADHVPGGTAHWPGDPQRSRHRRRRAAVRGHQFRRLVPVRRPDQGLADAAVHGLPGRQFHRMHHRYALLADRRAQIRQAGARPRHALRRRIVRSAQDQPDLDGFDDALQSRRRPADRCAGGARRRSATPISTIASRRASRISTICARAGRRRCARRTRIFHDHPTRQKHNREHGKARKQ